jgi:hypothetical protein
MEQQNKNKPLKLNVKNLVKRHSTSKEKSYNMILNEYYQSIADKNKVQKLKGINKKVVLEIAVKKVLRPDRPCLKRLVLGIRNSLKQKYGSKNNFYTKGIIHQLIKNKYCRINCLFKEMSIINSTQYSLKRFYLKKDCYSKLPSMVNYYKNYLKFFCKPTFKDFKLNNIIQNYGDNKAELYYRKNYLKNKTVEKKKEICEELKLIFNSSIKRIIDKHHLSSSENEESPIKPQKYNYLIKLNSKGKKFNPPKEETLAISECNQTTIKSGLLSQQNSIAKILSTFENDPDARAKRSEINSNCNTNKLNSDYFPGTLGNFKQKFKLETKLENLFDLDASNIKTKEPLTTRYSHHLKISPSKKTSNSPTKILNKNKLKIITKGEKVNMKINIDVNLDNIRSINRATENKLSRNPKDLMIVEDNLKNIETLLNPIFSSANANLNVGSLNININNNFNIQSPRNNQNEISKQKIINSQEKSKLRLSSNNLKFHLKSVSNVYPNKILPQNKPNEEIKIGSIFIKKIRK